MYYKVFRKHSLISKYTCMLPVQFIRQKHNLIVIYLHITGTIHPFIINYYHTIVPYQHESPELCVVELQLAWLTIRL